MKFTIILFSILGCSLAQADIVPPPPNYTIAVDGTVLDATGQVNDDPEQVVPLNATEVPIVQTAVTQVGDKVKTDWKNRLTSAITAVTPP